MAAATEDRTEGLAERSLNTSIVPPAEGSRNGPGQDSSPGQRSSAGNDQRKGLEQASPKSPHHER